MRAVLRAADISGLSAPYSDFFRADITGARCAGADLFSVNLHSSVGIDPNGPAIRAEGALLTDPVLASAEDFRPWGVSDLENGRSCFQF
jgi:hypothetical protein